MAPPSARVAATAYPPAFRSTPIDPAQWLTLLGG
jgi:hypothetical protein